MTSPEIRQSFLDFFREKKHTIVPSSSLLPATPNLLFTNAGMNQFVPYFLGEQSPPYSPPRAADTQKCIRAGGKHNDLDDVGLDTYHHTFFEMLGNWSFGDYFKKEAVAWAWELVVDRWKFPAKRVYATVYQPGPSDPSVFDQEAHDHWAALFVKAGLDPKVHIVNGNKKDNFWMMGETGPCGPCSELHVDLTSAGDTQGSLVNAGDPRCIEIWNLVFIQFNANPDGTFSPLPAKHVDTGMGFERVASIIQGTRNFSDFKHAKISNYETDIFQPIFDEIEKLSGKKYGGTLPKPGSDGENEQEKIDIAFRVIADHIRTLSFSIADGIEPGNTDRNYVLRRILRRAVRYGRALGFKEPFFYKLVGVLADSMGGAFPELRENRKRIESVLKTEEESFNRTLDTGTLLLEEAILTIDSLPPAKFDDGLPVDYSASKASALDLQGTQLRLGKFARNKEGKVLKEVSGDVAFKLYDTYGFPLDLTQVMARARGFTVNITEFESLMDAQRERGRAAQKKTIVQAGEEDTVVTDFVGFEIDHCKATVVDLRTGPKGETFALVDRSPLYAEMGGQVGDTGLLLLKDEKIPVVDTVKRGATFYLKLAAPPQSEIHHPQSAILQVDEPRRRAIEAHHTATHLLHWALHEVVDKKIEQKGSFVGPDRLRFDFNSAALTPAQLSAIEDLINKHTIANEVVSWQERPYAEVKERKDVMQFFGEKYGPMVRVVQIGGDPGVLNGYSMELCGGTHVRATGQAGAFAIVSEGAIAVGIRRIEAVTGLAAVKFFRERSATATGKVHELEAKLLELSKSFEKERAGQTAREASVIAEKLMPDVETTHAVPRLIGKIDLTSGGVDLLPAVANALKSRGFAGVAVLGGIADESAHLVGTVGEALTKQFHAGKLIGVLAPLVGGKGGGRPDMARGAGKDTDGLDALLAKARELIV